MMSATGVYGTHLLQQNTTVAMCLRVERRDSVVLGFTTADIDLPVDGVTYKAAPGLDISSLSSSSGLAVDNLELRILPDEATYPIADILAGLWDYAAWTLFEVDWSNPSGGMLVRKRGTTGEAQILRDQIVIEFRSLKDPLQQSLTEYTTKTCRARLGDARCRKDLTSFTVDHTVTTATSRQVFTASGASEAADYFKEGQITWLTGENAGYSEKVRSFSAGVFTLSKAMPFAVANADTFTAIAGCQKRVAEDCLAKFDNVLNFQGEPYLPGIDGLTAAPEGLGP
jgi:uncharacterized phage protein (TIGR02218 family)